MTTTGNAAVLRQFADDLASMGQGGGPVLRTIATEIERRDTEIESLRATLTRVTAERDAARASETAIRCVRRQQIREAARTQRGAPTLEVGQVELPGVAARPRLPPREAEGEVMESFCNGCKRYARRCRCAVVGVGEPLDVDAVRDALREAAAICDRLSREHPGHEAPGQKLAYGHGWNDGAARCRDRILALVAGKP